MGTFNLIASNIENLELKLKGELPVDRDELLSLVNSWGRNDDIYTRDKDNKKIEIKFCLQNEKYDLSKLDVSKITNFNAIFKYSNFDGDISKWDVSNSTTMYNMFFRAKNFNSPLNNWNTSNVTNMAYMFAFTENFNQSLNSWNISKVDNISFIFFKTENFNQAILWNLSNIKYCEGVFFEAKAFANKFNNGNELPYYIDETKKWLKENRGLMETIEIEDKIDNNKNSLDKLLEEKQIDPKSKLGLELIEIYNETQNKLKLNLDNLKNEVKTLAINDFYSL